MHKVYNETAPVTIFELFQKVSQPYPTGFSKLCYNIHKTNLTKCKYRISSRGVLIWSNCLFVNIDKQIESSSLFKCEVKIKLHSFFYKGNLIKTKALVLTKNLRTNQEQSQACCPAEHKNKVSRLAISKIIRTEHQNRAWLSFILYCM